MNKPASVSVANGRITLSLQKFEFVFSYRGECVGIADQLSVDDLKALRDWINVILPPDGRAALNGGGV